MPDRSRRAQVPLLHPVGRIAIVSDLHAFDPSKEDDTARVSSFLPISSAKSAIDPVGRLLETIKEEKLSANILLCCGDLGNKADPIAVEFGWSSIHKIGHALQAGLITSTVGNHDYDSRYSKDPYDAKSTLQALAPGFPHPEERMRHKFWSEHYCIVEGDWFNLLLLNTCAYHVKGTDSSKDTSEIDYGRISEQTIASIRQDLNLLNHKRVNVLACHHHPIPVPSPVLGELTASQAIRRGTHLLSTLGSGDYGHWLVVHGHLHLPLIYYAPGSSTAPVIFSAGSFSGNPWASPYGMARNQFYILDFYSDDFEGVPSILGRFQAWDWSPTRGWVPAGSASGLPSKGGFGNRLCPFEWAKQVEKTIRIAIKHSRRYVKWEAVIEQLPALMYVFPEDLQTIFRLLRDRGITVLLDNERGLPEVFSIALATNEQTKKVSP